VALVLRKVRIASEVIRGYFRYYETSGGNLGISKLWGVFQAFPIK
jgi:hypothetical protein